MKCPHCGETIQTARCQNCGQGIPEKSLFCCWCGTQVKNEKEEVKVDASERILCRDGTCIGTINEQGVCNVCGKPLA